MIMAMTAAPIRHPTPYFTFPAETGVMDHPSRNQHPCRRPPGPPLAITRSARSHFKRLSPRADIMTPYCEGCRDTDGEFSGQTLKVAGLWHAFGRWGTVSGGM